MSLKPGIGKLWIGKYLLDVYPHGQVVTNGVRAKAPRYYDKQFESVDPDAWAELAMRRELEGQSRAGDNTLERLKVKEQVTKARIRFLKRSI